MIDNTQKKVMLGNYGETVLSDILRNEGYEVRSSMDPFDRKKDLTVNGATVEVKTQVPFFSESAFSIGENQYRKCMNVDFVAFISVPVRSSYTNKYDGKIYVADSKQLEWRKRRTYDGRTMYLAKIDQPAMIECHTITNPEILKNLSRLTTSQA
jgi:hypothetical protein